MSLRRSVASVGARGYDPAEEIRMRPAYRYTLGFGVAVIGLGWGIGRWSAPPPPAPPVAVPDDHAAPLPLRPEGLQPVSEPVVGDPGPRQRSALLDELQQHDRARFGAQEAQRRRKTREQLIEGRLRER